ncbi:MAG: hypothetical protein KAS04_05810 [Candidatus Aenigmarchaeota archaeon]|nr:hypothetical protein [Candidatus Aenigmarchaeota archaeon]
MTFGKDVNWADLKDGGYIATHKPYMNGKTITLADVSKIDIKKFNSNVSFCGITMNDRDLPIVKFMKYCTAVSILGAEGTNDFLEIYTIPTTAQYNRILVEAIAGNNGDMKEFYNSIGMNNPYSGPTCETMGELLEIRGYVDSGKFEGKLKANVIGFDSSLKPKIKGSILLPAKNGFIKKISLKRGYPLEISEKPCQIENIEEIHPKVKADFSGRNGRGFYCVKSLRRGKKGNSSFEVGAEYGKYYHVLRGPRSPVSNLFDFDISETTTNNEHFIKMQGDNVSIFLMKGEF